jgi:cytochrome c2
MFRKIRFALTLCLGLMLACLWCQPNTAGQADEKPNQTKVFVIKPKGYSPQPISLESKKGQHYYDTAHCSACHSISDVGGKVGPLLDGIGQHRNSDFLFARLADTPDAINTYEKLTGQNSDNLVPHLRVSSSVAHSLVKYLLTLAEPSGGFVVYRHQPVPSEKTPQRPDFQPSPKTASTEEGKKLYEQFGCAQCHQIQHAGGYIGPSLDGIGRYSSDYLAAHITDAQIQDLQKDDFFELVPTSMPKFNATPEQIRKVTDYLKTLPQQ